MIRNLLLKRCQIYRLIKNLRQTSTLAAASVSLSHFPEETMMSYNHELNLASRSSKKSSELDQKVSKSSKKKKSIPNNNEELLAQETSEWINFKLKQSEKIWTSRVQRYHAYLYACLYANDVTSAQKCIDTFLLRAPINIIQENLQLYNTMLLILAKNDGTSGAKKLVEKLKSKNVQPNLNIISAMLQLAVNKKDKIDCKVVNQTLQLAKLHNLNVEEIFSAKVHGLDETESVLKAIRSVDKNFKPAAYTKLKMDEVESLHYDCGLAKSLEQPVSKDLYQNNGPYTDLLNKESVMEKFNMQLKRELNCRFQLPNISMASNFPNAKKKADFATDSPPSNNTNGGSKTSMDISSKTLNQMTHDWRMSLGKVFSENLKNLRRLSAFGIDEGEIALLAPFLKCLTFNDYVDIMCDSVWMLLTCTEVQHLQVSYVKGMLGRNVHQKFVNRVQLEHKIDEKISKIYEKYLDYFQNPEISRRYNQRQFWLKCALECFPEQPNIKVNVPNWPYKNVLLKLGEYMLDIMIKEVKINLSLFSKPNQNSPAAATDSYQALPVAKLRPIFYKVFCDSGKDLREHLRVEPSLMNFLQESTCVKSKLIMDVVDGPMRCPPVPWHSRDDGYFSFTPISLIRTPAPFGKFSDKINVLMDQYKSTKFNPALDALNQLGSTAWIVNGPVLDIALEVFRARTGDPKLAIPAEVGSLPQAPKFIRKRTVTDDSRVEIAVAAKQRREISKLRRETYSLWMTTLYKLSLANYNRNEILWFPHSLDFRGRAYPCPPHLNHMGDDLNRGILQFAKGQMLGEHGLDWLKVHCINLTGLKKKESLKARLEYCNAILPGILDSADDPLHGKQWWKESDEPWQTLAVCKEIANAVRSANPAEYVSRCPVHQDGSCNGLQHYAALGRDESGGKQVNLLNSETPQDVYSCVAALAEQRRADDAARGVEIAQICDGFIRRKVVKQTVMTIVYGVTSYGAKLQIEKQLRDIDTFPRDHCSPAARYLADLTFASIGALFNNTRKIQNWLDEIASVVSHDLRLPVCWKTPLEFPVVQPYFMRKIRFIANGVKQSVLAKHLHKFNIPEIIADSRKQRNGFPPNYIHSLDSTHMMLTALHCQRIGLTYASVHDCFWTHANNVEAMNRICRQQFVALHQEPVLQNLARHVMENLNSAINVNLGNERKEQPEKQFRSLQRKSVYNEAMAHISKVLDSVPKKGQLRLEDVLESTYFFS